MTSALESAEDLILRNTLLTAYEEDGVYTLLWWLHKRFPGADIAEQYRAAFTTTKALLLSGDVALVYATHPGDRPPVVLATSEALAVLARPSAWYPADPAQHNATLDLRLTEAGAVRLRHTPTADLMDGVTRVSGRPA